MPFLFCLWSTENIVHYSSSLTGIFPTPHVPPPPPPTPPPHPLFSKALDQLIFPFPLSPFFLFLFSLSVLDSHASGLWEIFIHIDRWRSWWVFHERRNSNCFCPTDVSKYQSPVGEVRAGLPIRAIKPQRPDSFSYTRIQSRSSDPRWSVCVFCDASYEPLMLRRGVFKDK